MKTRRIFPPLLVLILGALVITSSTSASIDPEHGASASGFGEFRFVNFNRMRTELWSFSFEAFANKNGQARGRAQFDNLTAGMQVTVRINCLNAGSGSAVMSGRVLHSDDPDLPKHTNVVFAATDAQTRPFPSFGDTITPVFEFGDFTCHDTEPLTILPVQNGDIQIQP
jgi:hypothetical protein